MPDIGTVVYEYEHAFNTATLTTSPVLWAGHYGHDATLLGQLSYPEIRGDQHMTIVAQGLMGPFTSPGVASSFLVTNLSKVGDPRMLLVSSLTDTSERVFAEHWEINVNVTDNGRLLTGVPERTRTVPSPVVVVLAAAGSMKADSFGSLSFDEAMESSVEYLKKVDSWTQ